MTPERWRQVTEIFHAAMRCDPAEQETFVADACGEDDVLRTEVTALIVAHRDAGGFGNTPLFMASDHVQPGRSFGPYRIEGLLGEGGMGEVYRARDARLGRDVAVKVLPAAWSADGDRLRRFAQEARAAAGLNHPHICTIYDVGTGDTGETPFIAMELLEGETLHQRLTRGAVEITRVIADGMGLADGLDAAHRKGILHRDIKPANIFLTAHAAKILDFGLAKHAAPGDESAHATESGNGPLTSPGSAMGTVAYMSPEHLRGETLDGRSDVFSLGSVLYEMATGRPAFTGATASVISAAILHTQPIAPRELRPELPFALDRTILKALEKDRGLRYQTAAELRSDLQARHNEMRSPPAPMAAATELSEAPPRRVARRAPALVVIAVVLLAGLALWSSGIGRTDSSSAQAGTVGGPHRLVVLPFENTSGELSDQWLAGAFADSLTLGLRHAENLVLVNRERVLELGVAQNRLDSGTVARIVKTLAVRYYVEGSYQRVGDDVRVFARLVDAEAGTISVQESLTDRFANLLNLQDDLARKFVTALHLSPAVEFRTRTSSLAAYQAVAEANDLYLAGRYRDAIAPLQSSVKQDATYADAWALLGKSYARLAGNATFDRGDRSEFQSQALKASQRAVAINPMLYEAQVSLALAHRELAQTEPQRQAAQRAIELNPRLAEAYEILATSYSAGPFDCARQRDPGMAERLYAKAVELDPQLVTAHVSRAASMGWDGRVQDGFDYLTRMRDVWPTDVRVLRFRAVALLWLQRPDEAEEQVREVASLGPTSVQDEWVLAGVELVRGNRDASKRRFAAAIARGPVPLREIDTAFLYGLIGDPHTAARHLEHAFVADPSCPAFVAQSANFARFRDHPAIQDVMSKHRLP
jgi:serine/threonine protein kinase/TolB-like protein